MLENMDKRLYFAPLEGITTYTYRNTHSEMFEGCDEYYAPFISPSDLDRVSNKIIRDILPENNKVDKLKVQVLTNRSDSFFLISDKIKELGYNEINLNFGCPSSTVVKKGRGAGFLKNPDVLKSFLEELFSKEDIKLSVKTRTGFYSGDEMDSLIGIYNEFPLSMLIIHPRAREDYYKGMPDMDVFKRAFEKSKNKVCYNGNIYSLADYERICKEFPDICGVMIGRGAVKNPAIFRHIKGGNPISTDELIKFSEKLMENYMVVLNSDTFTLHKLKEIWVHMIENYPEEKKINKALKKSKNLAEFKSVLYALPEL